MTIFDVRQRIEAIKAKQGDYEVMHGMEDDLMEDVLRAIARGTYESDPMDLAEEVLKVKNMDFPRHCA